MSADGGNPSGIELNGIHGKDPPEPCEERIPMTDSPETADPPACGWIKKKKKLLLGIAVLVCLIFLVGIGVGFLIWGPLPADVSHEGQRDSSGETKCRSTADSCLCMKGWVYGYGKYYYISDEEGDWNYSQINCSSHGASLAKIDTQEEMTFILRQMHSKGSSDHWIGLRREGKELPWKWTDGSVFNKSFEIGDNGYCVYLNNKSASSTLCYKKRNWICSQPAPTT